MSKKKNIEDFFKVETLADMEKWHNRRLDRSIEIKGKGYRMVYRKRLEKIDIFMPYYFYDMNMANLDFEKQKDWFWHMAGKPWIQDKPGLLVKLRHMLQDIQAFQARKKENARKNEK